MEFERAICRYTGGAAHAVAVNSGTSALQLAIRALGIERGAEVILPSFTFSAVLNVVLLEGLRPRFVDIGPHSYNCGAETMLAAVTPETQLIIAVHTFGAPVDVQAIVAGVNSPAREGRRIHSIEDACEALGAKVHGRKAGTIADAGWFAFYPNKQITTGEGGCSSPRTTKLRARQLGYAIKGAIRRSAGIRMRDATRFVRPCWGGESLLDVTSPSSIGSRC